MLVLFVCTGNICRSPTAERLAAAYASQTEIPNVQFASAGTRAVVGSPVHPQAAVVLNGLGGDASGFAARQLTPRIASGADLILTMSTAHRDTVLELVPHKLHRTFTLREASCLASENTARSIQELAEFRSFLAGSSLTDVTDPIGQDADIFKAVGAEISELLPPILRLCGSSFA